MSLPYLPGWGDTLAQSGGAIGQNIAHIINPNVDFQKMFKAAIAQDPTLLQKIANNPGLADALSKAGLGNSATNATQGLQIDPSVLANQQILGANAQVAQGTVQSKIQEAQSNAATSGSNAISAASKARVDTATEQPNISVANSQARLLQTQSDEADRKHKLAADALAKYPSLAGININQLANDIASGKPLDAQLAARIDQEPGAQEALVEGVRAAMNRQEIASRYSIAELKKKDPDYKVAALSGMDRALKEINDRINSANGTIKAVQSKNPLMLSINAQSADPNISGPAKQDLEDLKNAKADLEDRIDAKGNVIQPGLRKQWQELANKRTMLLGMLGNGVDAVSVTGGSKVTKTKTPGNSDPVVTQLKQDVKNDPQGRAKLKKLLDMGKITQDQFNQTLAGN